MSSTNNSAVSDLKSNVSLPLTQDDKDRILNSKIKYYSIYQLIKFINEQQTKTEKDYLSIQNYALCFNKLATAIINNNQDSIIFKNLQNIQKLCNDVIFKNKNCPKGEFAQIVKGLAYINDKASFSYQSNFISYEKYQWINKNILDNLSSFTSQELYMTLLAANKILSKEDLKKIFSALNNQDNKKELIKGMFPQGLSTLLKTAALIEENNDLTKSILITIIQKKNEFNFIELIDLISGLKFHLYKDNKELELLKYIDSELVKCTDNSINLIIALKNFSKVGYIPSKEFLLKIQDLLDDDKTPIWDDIYILYSIARLNLDNYQNFIIKILNKLNENEYYKKIYPSDLILFSYTIAALYQGDIKELKFDDIVSIIFSKIEKLNYWQKTKFKNALMALSRYDLADKIFIGDYQKVTTSNPQSKLTQSIRDWFKINNLININIMSEAPINGRKVDILIDKFEKYNIKQSPLVLEIDGPNHFACNDNSHLLGKTVIRNKIFKNLKSHEYHIFDLKKGVDNTELEILKFLNDKLSHDWSKKNQI